MLSNLQQLISYPGFLKYFKNTSWLFVEKVLRMIVGLFVGIWVARYLGPEQFGLFSYAQSLVGIFAIIASLGLDGIIIRDFVKDKSRRDELIGTAFYLKLFGSFITLLTLAITINFISNNSFTNLLIFIIASGVVFQAFNVVDLYFQSNILSKYVVYANIISLAISSIIKVLLIINEASLVYFAWVILFDNMVLALGFIYFYTKQNLTIFNWQFNKNTAITLLKNSWPFLLSGVAWTLHAKIDQVMIKEMLNVEAVGQYVAAVQLSEAWYFIPVIIGASLFPAIINAKKISKKLYYARLQRFYDLMVWLAIAIAIPVTFLSHWIVDLLYGKEYHEAGSVLVIHIWTAVFMFLFIASGKWFISENLSKETLYRNISGVIVNISLNYYLIPLFGIVGAAYATLVSYFVAGMLYDISSKKLRISFMLKINSFFIIFRLLKRKE